MIIIILKDAKSIWYLKYQIPSPKKYLEKYLNTQKLTRIWHFIYIPIFIARQQHSMLLRDFDTANLSVCP